MNRNILLATVAVLSTTLVAPKTEAFDLDFFDTDNNLEDLVNALFAPSSGISLVPGSITFQGNIGDGINPNTAQSALYSNFSLAPNFGSSPTLTLPDGIFLTTGTANIPRTNTVNNFSVTAGSGGNAQLTGLSGTSTFDANVLTFQFTVDDPTNNSVQAQFLFGTDEFPTQSVTDIFGFFVDGVNFAQFPSGELISNTPGNPTNFISNPVGGGLYDIEFNGLTRVFNVAGLLDPTLSTHTLSIGIADTFDTIFDSGAFIGGLKAGVSTGGGITDPDDPQKTPEPSMILTFVGLAILGTISTKKQKKTA